MLLDKLNQIVNYEPKDSLKYVIGEYMKNNFSEIPEISIDTIAMNCHTSKSQISKFVKSLGYASMKDFKFACEDNLSGLRRTNLSSVVPGEYIKFRKESIQILEESLAVLDDFELMRFMNEVKNASRIFIYAHGHARSLCIYMQNEFASKGKEAVLCDVDFFENYHFQKNDILVFISANGNTFHFEQRLTKRILSSPVNTWLISCNGAIPFSKNKLIIPVENTDFQILAIFHVLSFVLRY